MDQNISCSECLYLTSFKHGIGCIGCMKTGYCIPNNLERSEECKKGNFKRVGVLRMDIEDKIPFRVIHIFPSCSFPNHPLSSSQSVVEFYDLRYKQIPDGEYITRYNVSTLYKNSFESSGLDLHNGESKWKVSSKSMQKIINWLRFNDRNFD